MSIFNQEPEDNAVARFDMEPDERKAGLPLVLVAWAVLSLSIFWGAVGYGVGRLTGCE